MTDATTPRSATPQTATSSAIDDVLSAKLAPAGAWPPDRPPLEGAPQAAVLELADDGRVSTGIWECTPGRFTSERTGCSELMHFVAGAGTIADDTGTVHAIAAGVVLFVPDGWSGEWNITETVRKTYAMVSLA